jgi:hypothetical protein
MPSPERGKIAILTPTTIRTSPGGSWKIRVLFPNSGIFGDTEFQNFREHNTGYDNTRNVKNQPGIQFY